MKHTCYGNWVPSVIFKISVPITIFFLFLSFVFLLMLKKIILFMLSFILFLFFLTFTVYMWLCYRCFSFKYGKLMEKIHKHLLV